MNYREVVTRLKLIQDELYAITDGECDVHGWTLVQLAIKHLNELLQSYELESDYAQKDAVESREPDEGTQQAEDEHIYNRIVAEGLHCTKRGG